MRLAVLLSFISAASICALPVAEPVPGPMNAGSVDRRGGNVDWRRGNGRGNVDWRRGNGRGNVDWRRGNGRGNVDWRRGVGNNNWRREVDERSNRDSRQSEAEADGNVDWRRSDTDAHVEARGYRADVRGNVDWKRNENEAAGYVD